MSGTLLPLLRLMKVPRWRLAWEVLLGALTVIFGGVRGFCDDRGDG